MNKKWSILKSKFVWLPCFIVLYFAFTASSQPQETSFAMIAFYTAKNDLAHISFVHEANQWFSKIAAQYRFTYNSSNNWNNLNDSFLENNSAYQNQLIINSSLWLGESKH